MFRRQHTIRAFTALGLGASVLFSSTGAAPHRSAHSVVNLVMWQQWGGGHEKRTLDKYIALFNRTHPTIHVSEIAVTDNSKIVAAISGGRPPDLMDLGTTQTIGQWAHDGLLQPLDSDINASHIDVAAFYPSGWKAVTFEGKRWGVPFMNFNLGLLYNRALFKQAGITHPPRTLEELDRDAAKLTVVKNGRIERMGFIPDYPASNLEWYSWLFGGDWFTGHTSSAASAANVRALQWEASYYKKYGASNVKRFISGFGQDLTAADGFESGKVAMLYDGEWNIAFTHENVPSLQVGAAPFPAPANHANLTGTSYIDTNPQVIPAGSPHPKEAFEFIQWETTNPQLAAEYSTLVVNLPQLKSVPSTPLFRDPNFQVFVKESAGSNAHQLPMNPISVQFATNLGTTEQAALLGKSTPQQALLDLQKMTQQELNSTH